MEENKKTIARAIDVYNIKWPTDESWFVLYDDDQATFYYDHMLNSMMDQLFIKGRMVQIRYILLIDNFRRVCAIYMREQEVGAAGSSLMHEQVPQYTHSFCALYA
ncbi:BgTH12-05192 [Blumeria graminis f. sp. triticale]|uniref:BgtE-10118-2 n=2 Tax=Blumeria graminis TaxID=34373 RepID=A0A9X9QD37_BLUGR|nr:BgTH12-05192 [Blumeria graminis f. sp. triticale]VDB88019.1 BgtE-10118-2 [Blumeria graminis f. sp. tritici]